MSGQDQSLPRDVRLPAADDQVVVDPLDTPAGELTYALLEVVAELLLLAGYARTFEEEEQCLEQALSHTLTPKCRRASFREVFWSVDSRRSPIMRAVCSW